MPQNKDAQYIIDGGQSAWAYQTILQAGASNQLDEKLLEDIYGKVPRT